MFGFGKKKQDYLERAEAEEERAVKWTAGSPDVYSDFWYNAVGHVSESGVAVNEHSALKYTTLASCVTLISGDVARLPLILYQKRSDGSKERVVGHPLYSLLHDQPNPEMDSLLFRDSGEGHLLLWGNHYSYVDRHPYTGEVRAVWPLSNPGAVEVKRDKQRRIYYKWRDDQGKTRQYYKKDMLHIPGFGFDGIKGLSPLSMARETVGHGMAIKNFGSRYFSAGTHPSVVVSLPVEFGGLGDQEEKYKASLNAQYAGLGKSHGIMILPNGEEFKSISIPMEDAQFIESSVANRTEICGFYRVPPHKVGIHSANTNRNNTEQENQAYIDGCLMLWLSRWEKCLTNQLLTNDERKAGLFFEFLVDGMLRGDSQARSEYYQKVWQVGAISQNEIRAKENLNPVEGGDEYYVPLNFIPSSMAKQVQAQNENPPEEKSFRSMPRYDEQRSVLTRDRISRQYYPLFVQAAQDIVDREAETVMRGLRSPDPFEKWLAEFYRDLPDYIKRRIGPVFGSFAEAVRTATAEEIGVNASQDEFERFLNGYIDTYAVRHIESSRGQLEKLYREEEVPAIEQRVGEWQETRAEKIATNETTRASNAVFQTVAWAAGMSTVWRIRGAETCPYCKTLNGKRVARNQWFLSDGDEVSPDGKEPMKIYGMRRHPPLHKGCDCYLGVGF